MKKFLGVAVVLVGLCDVQCGGRPCFDCDTPNGDDASASDVQAVDASTPDTSVVFPDVKVPDANVCKALNIGMIGQPGKDPSSNFQQWLASSGATVTRIQTSATDPQLDSGTISSFDVIVLDWLQREFTSAEASLIEARVTAGAGLISMTGYYTPNFYANTLLKPLGVAYYGSLMDGPVTSFVVNPMTKGLTSVTFQGGYGIEELGGASSSRTPIAFLNSENVAYAIELGQGHAFVWGDEWIEFDTQWTTLPEIKQLWIDVFGWVAPQGCPLQPPN